jgi:hypothetical protein
MMRMASKSVMGLESSKGFERNKVTLLGGPHRRLPRLFPGFIKDPSFPGSGVYRFQEEPWKQLSVFSSQFSVRLCCTLTLSITIMLKTDRDKTDD